MPTKVGERPRALGAKTSTSAGAPTSRRRKGFDPTPEERAQLERVMAELHRAMETADMDCTPPRVPKVNKTSCGRVSGSPGWLGRLRELAEDGEPDPVQLLVAVAQAKVDEHARNSDQDEQARLRKRKGRYCHGTTICRDQWWASNLAAGRAWLIRSRPKARPVEAPKPTEPGMDFETLESMSSEAGRLFR